MGDAHDLEIRLGLAIQRSMGEALRATEDILAKGTTDPLAKRAISQVAAS